MLVVVFSVCCLCECVVVAVVIDGCWCCLSLKLLSVRAVVVVVWVCL